MYYAGFTSYKKSPHFSTLIRFGIIIKKELELELPSGLACVLSREFKCCPRRTGLVAIVYIVLNCVWAATMIA